jgi:hypothetical protein
MPAGGDLAPLPSGRQPMAPRAGMGSGDLMIEGGSTKTYVVTSAVFLVIAGFGIWRFFWGENEFAFLLLLYFIVVLGIRLDDINKELQRTNRLLTQMLNRSDADAD